MTEASTVYEVPGPLGEGVNQARARVSEGMSALDCGCMPGSRPPGLAPIPTRLWLQANGDPLPVLMATRFLC